MTTKKRLEFVLDGLDCVNCANKIENNINNIEDVNSASVNFVTKTLIVETNCIDTAELKNNINTIIKRLEPHIVVKEKEKVDIGEEKIDKIKIIRLSIGVILFLVAIFFKFSFVTELSIYLISYLLVGGDILLKAIKNISRGEFFDENFLMGIATLGAFAIKEFPEGVAVMLFYKVGEFFQEMAVNRSRKSITALMDIRPDFANIKIGDEIKKVSPTEVKIGDIIIVKPGEKVPLDGEIIEGSSMLDTSALTGESVPRRASIGDDILSGCINQNSVIAIKVTKLFGDSTVSKILDLVQNATSKKAKTENFITKFSKYYTPVVVLLAVALAIIPPLFIQGATFTEWINRALVFLVISCPCALVISIPLGFFGGIGSASKNGILVKGSNYLEALNNVDTVVFDKTGTLTKGVFKVTEIKTENNISEIELLEYAAYAESFSSHPIAISIINAFNKEIDRSKIEEYNEISGHGISVKIRGKLVLAGNNKLMQKENIAFELEEVFGTIVHIAIDGTYKGYIVISDEIKEDSKLTMKTLKDIGVKRTVMLTGDNKVMGEKVATALGIDIVFSELLPGQKVEKLEMLINSKSTKGNLIFVGDGINDAPVLARADVGVAMGGIGSDAAIEEADIVLMTDEPLKIVKAIKIAKRTRKIVWQNIAFALIVKGIVLALGAGGIATMWEAVFADVGVSVIAILNAMRVMKK